MPTSRETIFWALDAVLSTLLATALRGEVLPKLIPADGLLIPRDGEPGPTGVLALTTLTASIPAARSKPARLVLDHPRARPRPPIGAFPCPRPARRSLLR